MNDLDSENLGLMPRIVAGVFGLTFGGIGLTILISLWSVPFHSFHSPPLFFRITGSLMSLPFIAIGLGTLYQVLAGKPVSPTRRMLHTSELVQQALDSQRNTKTTVPNSCPHCNAPRGNAEVSPRGDVKCLHCHQWYSAPQT